MEFIKNANLAMLTNYLIRAYESNAERFLLGITGIPAAGKSTLAAMLMKNINKVLHAECSIVVPMDGFHYHNDILLEKGLLPLKGIPETFDANGFVNLIERIASAATEQIFCPSYDRSLHNPVQNAIMVEDKHKIIIVEGNYLLLETPPWQKLTALFNEIWFIDTPFTTSHKRLIRRHMKPGHTVEEALNKIESTDKPNAKLIAQTRQRAAKIITLQEF